MKTGSDLSSGNRTHVFKSADELISETMLCYGGGR